MVSRKEFISTTIALSASSLIHRDFVKNFKSTTLIKPKKLKKGATIGLVAPASPIYSDEQFDVMLKNLKGQGFKLKLGTHVKDRNGYLAGKDKDRAHDIMTMFNDHSIDAIVCTRGGWGSNRILPLIDFEIIKSNPKIFIGFSDITSLHMAISEKTGLVTFHGPVGKSDWNEFTLNSFNDVLMKGEANTYHIPKDQTDSFIVNNGISSGRLLGGNLTVLTSLIGTDFLPNFDGAILFLEDIGEEIYKIDRMLTQLDLSGILSSINGFVFGKCTDCNKGVNSLSLKEVFGDHLSKYDIPAFYGAMISHENKNITLPVGIKAEINANNKTIRLLESGVI